MSNPENCQACRFWKDARTSPNHYGECRRAPPTHRPVKDDAIDVYHPTGQWPTTKPYDWCGDFSRRTT